ncbi:MAG: ribosome biogenesis GTPase Der [Chloroflexi bacterium]|nr:ribosome biogenesis GTPase Der [Chloroflexota bacterium]
MGKKRRRKPIVALVGRPNVGKSTLFNRLIGQKWAIVEDKPGTTRDRIYGDVVWGDREFTLVDTGGLEIIPHTRDGRPKARPLAEDSRDFIHEMQEQVNTALREADVIVLVTDVTDGVTPVDRQVADLLRQEKKPVILAVNKVDNPQREVEALAFYELGLGDPIPVSALHGKGTGDLLDAILQALPHAPEEEEEEEDVIRVAIVGRPNVGKSTLLNRLAREERAIVSDVAGTTRDVVDTRVRWEGKTFLFLDTAGIRRKGSIQRGVEYYSVLRAMRAIERSDVVLLVLDATEGVTAQDAHIAGYALEAYRSIIIVVNKWDLVEKDTYTMVEYTRRIRHELNFIDFAPIVFISAKTGQRVSRLFPLIEHVYEERFVRLPTSMLNRIIQEALAEHPPPVKGTRALRLYYVTQPAVDPPTFVFFVNDAELVHFSYQRYLENKIREIHPYDGTPLKLIFRSHEGKRKGK